MNVVACAARFVLPSVVVLWGLGIRLRDRAAGGTAGNYYLQTVVRRLVASGRGSSGAGNEAP